MNFKLRESFKSFKSEGFSLIELIIVIAVLAILSVVGIPYFLKVINLARFESAKNHMRDSFTSCINNPNISLSNPYIPGVAFQSSNCSSLISATIDNSCTISMDMSTGAKTGWYNSYDECTSATNTASNNGSGETNNGTGDSNNNSGDQVVIWSGTSCSNNASDVLPEYMSKGDKNFTNAYGVLQKWLSDSSNLEKTNSLPNSQSSSNKYHNFQIRNSGEAIFGEFFDDNTDLKDEINNALDNSSQSDYQFDVWLNPQGNISVRRLGPQGYWRTAGHKVADCN